MQNPSSYAVTQAKNLNFNVNLLLELRIESWIRNLLLDLCFPIRFWVTPAGFFSFSLVARSDFCCFFFFPSLLVVFCGSRTGVLQRNLRVISGPDFNLVSVRD